MSCGNLDKWLNLNNDKSLYVIFNKESLTDYLMNHNSNLRAYNHKLCSQNQSQKYLRKMLFGKVLKEEMLMDQHSET